MRARLRIPGAVSAERSRSIVSNLERSAAFSGVGIIIGFMAMKGEPDAMEFLRGRLSAGCTVMLPSYNVESGQYGLSAVGGLDDAWLHVGRYGIPEPLSGIARAYPPYSFSDRALWLVPGLAFSPGGMRLGRGGGFYDRLLEKSDGLKVGLLFDCQLLPRLPSEPHDAVMDCLVTETRIINCEMHRVPETGPERIQVKNVGTDFIV